MQPRNVVPSAELESDLPEHANWDEPKRLMYAKTGRIRQGDTGIRVHIALPTQEFEQSTVKRSSDPAAMCSRLHIDGYLDAPLVCVTGAVRRGVGVPQNGVVALEHEPGVLVALCV